MTDDKTWMHRALPALPPAEAERLVGGLGEQAWHELCGLMELPDPEGHVARMAAAYSGIIADLLADRSRKADAHRRRWLVWHLSGGDIEPRGVGLTVTRWLDAHPQLCGTFGFPAGEAERKRRSAIVKELLKEMRATVLDGGQPYTLSKADEMQLEVVMAFEILDKK